MPWQTCNLNPFGKHVGDCVVRALSLALDQDWDTTVLKGAPKCPYDTIARYSVTLNGNIAIPTGGAVTPIAMAITVSGEARQSSKAIFTPAAVDEFGNITSTATVDVPRGCCFIISAEYVDATTADAATTPTPVITIENGSMIIDQSR